MQRIKMTIMYDGTDYCGFQRQPNRKTVQECVENAIFEVFGERLKIYASGRTDKGVHANGQVVHFDLKTTIDAKRVYKVINAKLPSDIVAISSEKVENEFNARYGAKRKTYRYQMYLREVDNPFASRYALKVSENIDVEKMKRAAKCLVGKHDFVALSSTGSGVTTSMREIFSAELYLAEDWLVFEIIGSGFLYNMVRIIVGTLIEIGMGTRSEDALFRAIEKKDRKLAGRTAPANGLFLQKVEY